MKPDIKIYLFAFVLAVIFSSNLAHKIIQGKVCITPSDNVRRCVPLEKCPTLSKLSKKSEMTSEDQNLIRSYSEKCQKASANHVCCDDLIEYETESSVSVESTTVPLTSSVETPTTTTPKVDSTTPKLDFTSNVDVTTFKEDVTTPKDDVITPEVVTDTDPPLTNPPVTITPSTPIISDAQCTTPNNKVGTCIEIKKCSPLINLVRKRPVTQEARDFVTNSRCSQVKKPIFVCCPNDGDVTIPSTTEAPKIELGNGIAPRFSLLPTTDECGQHHSDRHVFGGVKTALDEFPWLALIHYRKSENDPGNFGCGGSLISKRYILTAAHCLSPEALALLGNRLRVRLGEYDIKNDTDCTLAAGCSPPPQDIEVEQIIVHPGFRMAEVSRRDDIGLIRLKRDVEYSTFIQPVCLPNQGKQITWDGDEHTWVAGWGRTETGGNSNIKLKLKVPRISMDICQRELSELVRNPQLFKLSNTNQICAGGQENRDACSGDSGGPLMSLYVDDKTNSVSWFSTGIVSFGTNKCGVKGKPGVYTQVNSYVDWIVSNMKP